MTNKKVKVIGGGLAGLYAAHQAAIKGMEVTLYERNTIGTKYNCGELFTELYTTVPEECKISKINTFIFKIGKETLRIEFGDKSPFVMTDKIMHETIIRDRCIEAGVDILEKTVTNSKLSAKTSFLIDASGIKSWIGTNVGKAMTLNCTIKDLSLPKICEPNEALFVLRDDCKGYLWAFPKNNAYNIGDGFYDYKHKAVLSKESIMAGLGLSNLFVAHKGGGLLPMPTMLNYYDLLINSSSIKVGNAAGLINPALGGGEHLAVLSGMLAGELVATHRYPITTYYKALDEIIGDEMRFGITMFEYLKKQDSDYILEFLRNKLITDFNSDFINKTIRKTMAKWITINEVHEDEVIDFIKGE